MKNHEFIVQLFDPDHERPWYVQEVCLMDMGRFKTKEEAEAHKQFLDEKYQHISE